METYIVLGNWTQQGIAHAKESPARIEGARRVAEASGGKLLGWFLTMGRYDYVLIAQMPSAEAVAAVLLAYGAQGNGRTETLRAFTESEFKDILSGVA